MATSILVELTLDDAAVPAHVSHALRALDRHGLRVSAVDGWEGPESAALASLLRLALKAEPLAGRLAREFGKR